MPIERKIRRIADAPTISLHFLLFFTLLKLCCLVDGFVEERTANLDEKRFTVLRVPVAYREQLDFLLSRYLNSHEYDFWREPTTVGRDVHVMVGRGPQRDALMEELQSRHFANVTVMIDDVEKVIKKRRASRALRRHLGNRLLDDAPSSGGRRRGGRAVNFSLGQYHSFAEIINYMNSLAISYPDRVQVQPIGTTHEGRQIPLIRIGTNRQTLTKPAIWIDGGIHAREWVSPAAVLFFIHQLVTEYDTQPMIRQLVDELDWYVVPLLNPDGYEFSRSATDPEVRLWRKNRSPVQCTQTSTGEDIFTDWTDGWDWLFSPPQTQCCQGVDLNRNFDWFFGQIGSSTDPCSEIFSGPSAFSEPETRAVRNFLSQLDTGRVRTFLTFHSYSQILMYPFGYAQRTYPQDVNELAGTAQSAAQALQSVYGTRYVVGTGADTLYPASGGSEDWAKGRIGVKFSYLFELRPEDNVYDGFLLKEEQIIPTARETWEAVKVIAGETLRQFPPQLLARPKLGPPTPPLPGPVGSPTLVCRDLDPLCSFWAQSGACPAWPSLRDRCPAACGFC